MHRQAIFILWVLLLYLAAGPAFGEDRIFSLRIGGRERTWLVHTPPGFDGKTAVPAVIVLHGGGGNARGIAEASRFSRKADAEGFIVVYPNGTGRSKARGLTWNAGNGSGWALAHDIDDIGFLQALIGSLPGRHGIDPKRIYLAGLSNGGMMTYRAARELSGLIAAAGVVAGVIAPDGPEPSRPVPVIIFHGTADDHVRYEGGRPKKTVDYPVRNDLPVSAAVAFWVKRNGCAAAPRRVETDAYLHDVYPPGPSGATVELYTVKGGGHAWFGGARDATGDEPGTAVDATALMWDFFVRERLP